jgi:hypothetical protein
MSSALSEPEGAGLGTLGFNEAVARRASAEAGFTRFVRHDFENPLNANYESGLNRGLDSHPDKASRSTRPLELDVPVRA